MVSESPGRNMRERRSSLETVSLGGRDSYLMSKTVETVAYWLKRHFSPAGYQRRHGGKVDMIKSAISLQDLRREIYIKAKAEPAWRFW